MEWVCTQCDHAVAGGEPGLPCPLHGGTLVRADVRAAWPGDPLLGRVLDGRYALHDILGRGGMGAVYRGRHLRLGRDVALKTLLPQGREVQGFDVRERFFLEARMLAGLNSPGVVSLHDYGEDAGRLFMVLELVEGLSLQALLRAEGRLSVARAVRLARGMLEALAAPHARGLVHRDIKPGNIMIRPSPQGGEGVVLIDFGVAKAFECDDESLSGPATRTGLTIGTPRYMAPEQLADLPVSAAADQYAVGVVLFRMLAGQAPFVGPSAVVVAAHLKDPAPPLPAALGVPAPIEAVIQRALSKAPEARFESCAAMAAALEAAQHASPPPAWGPPRPVPVPVAVAGPGADLSDGPEASQPLTPPWQGEVAAVPVPSKRRLGVWFAAAAVFVASAVVTVRWRAPEIDDPVAPPVRVSVGGRPPASSAGGLRSASGEAPAPPAAATVDAGRPGGPALPSPTPPQGGLTVASAVKTASAGAASAPPRPKPVRRAERPSARHALPASAGPSAPRPAAPASADTLRPPASAAAPPPDPTRRVEKLLEACLCADAKLALSAVPAARRGELEGRVRARCDVVGIGCNAGP